MSRTKSESHVIAIRLSTEERDSLAALAAVEGKSVSAYLRGLLTGAKARPRPILAAAGELLAICVSLIEASEQHAYADEARVAVEENAKRVIAIVRLHGQVTMR